ncbi:DNA replication/repair protein RecF [Glycomyces terrestris]|uniref:DNA replication and repair protein RecF n=2 Tax=Glycomyces terrestris TaxID=2493553 RepID=A0A426UYL8_9ACTN|nr:DNA replication/repair protein RecF [Glycomyces terrestris]RRR99658.1 DNA replication/repair protein RecF [Glycomyces terrestris]
MRVRQLQLTDFRSYAHAQVMFDEGPSILVGPNGHGKTNLVESLVYLANLRSHRVSSDAPLVRQGCEQAVVRAEILHDSRRLLAELAIVPGKSNKARLNRTDLKRPREIIGALKAVAFAPEDLALVRGEPSARRRYLDELLCSRYPRFAGVRADYDRVLKQRNTLLRTAYLAKKTGGRGPGGAEMATLDAWDAHLATHGAELMAGRLALLEDLAEPVAKAHSRIADGRAEVALTYESELGDGLTADRDVLGARLAAALAAARAKEVERGSTLVGPHRDDLDLVLGDLPVKGYASHGETWSVALALRLGAFELLRADGTAPILILDDVFAELDAVRRERLAEYAEAAPQALITCAVAGDVPDRLAGARYDVWEGEVKRVL